MTCFNDDCNNPRKPTKSGFYKLCGSCLYGKYKAGGGLYDPTTRVEWRYKTTIDELQILWKDQGLQCPICYKPGPEKYSPSREWFVDHDHKCCPGANSCGKCVRGIVCFDCNIHNLTKHMSRDTWEAVGRYLGYA